MARIISASIDLTKIDKSKIQKVNKEGQPFKNGAQYLNIDIVVNDEVNDYGQDTSVKLSQTQEERQAKAPATYLGNGKTVWNNEGSTQSNTSSNTTSSQPAEEDEDDLPF